MKRSGILRYVFLLAGAIKKKTAGRHKADKEIRGIGNCVSSKGPEADKDSNNLKGTPGMRIVDPDTGRQVGVFDGQGRPCVNGEYIKKRLKAAKNNKKAKMLKG